MKRTRNSRFASIPKANISRSKFDLSSGTTTTFDSGLLIPFWAAEGLPGDTWNVRMRNFTRMATPIKPVMDAIYLESFFFAVPNRILWENWVHFMGEQDDPGDDHTSLVTPQIATVSGGWLSESLFDYLGMPTLVHPITASVLWCRAYNKIWQEFFRDENMQDSPVIRTTNAGDLITDYPIRARGKRKDYFTSALPFAQKGTAVSLPLGTVAPVVSTGDGNPTFDFSNQTDVGIQVYGTGASRPGDVFAGGGGSSNDAAVWNQTKLEADLSGATAATINDLRYAAAIQRLYERDARGGTRYTELLEAHFQVSNPDSRMQRPEYLGGGSQVINITPVPQTSETDTGTEQGNLAGFGTSSGSGHGFVKSFTEHMTLLGLVSVRAELRYQQGLPRMFSRQSRWDYYWPELAHVGEQEIKNIEIFADGSANDDLIFGYTERHAEYRTKQSMITGLFRSNHPQSLDVWHVAQDFAAVPVLDGAFIIEKPAIDRVIAVPSEPHWLFESWTTAHVARPMPTYGTPGHTARF